MAILPERPLKVRQRFAVNSLVGGLTAAGFCAAAAVGFPVVMIDQAREIQSDLRRWDLAHAVTGAVEWQERSRFFVFHEFELGVSDGQEGVARGEGRVKFDTLLGSPDTDQAPEIRIDDERPDAPLLSWAIEASNARWMATAFVQVASLMLAGTFASLAW